MFVLVFCFLFQTVLSNYFVRPRESLQRIQKDTSLLNVAYFLRQGKFSDFDRRSDANGVNHFPSKFPDPPLDVLHWEVKKFCQTDFNTCLSYLNNIVEKTGLKRTEDTVWLIHEKQWDITHEKDIEKAENECWQRFEESESYPEPFISFMDRFEWRISAMYFMCYYTMEEEPVLEHFFERCDYHLCLSPDPDAFPSNLKDHFQRYPRINDSIPFACAMVSFCPDPCFDRQCEIERTANTDLSSLIANRINTTAPCPNGLVWSSPYHVCLEENECLSSDACAESETCLNTVEGKRCACMWGFIRDPSGSCRPDPILDSLFPGLDNIPPVHQPSTTSHQRHLSALAYPPS